MGSRYLLITVDCHVIHTGLSEALCLPMIGTPNSLSPNCSPSPNSFGIMPVEQPSNIYREQLTSLYHGLALWKPNPVEDIYDQVSIGDVGYISSEGIFIRMFNVTLPWDDRSNRRLADPEPYDSLTLASIVRENFSQVDYYSRHVSREENTRNIQAATHEE
jgi:hypothetical protein